MTTEQEQSWGQIAPDVDDAAVDEEDWLPVRHEPAQGDV